MASSIPSLANGQTEFPLTLMTVEVVPAAEGEIAMDLPSGPLPVDQHLLDLQERVLGGEVVLDASRRVIFELCGMNQGQFNFRLPSCDFYSARYEAMYWGGIDFDNMAMMRDRDDIGFIKEGLFTAGQNLFEDMFGGNVEEWTIINHTFSDHPFHIHQNPFLVTRVNGMDLPMPEWHDTILVPSAVPPTPDNPVLPPNEQPPDQNITNINNATPGSITFRTYLDPRTQGRFVAHCHILTHEDVGMMQALEIKERPHSATAQN